MKILVVNSDGLLKIRLIICSRLLYLGKARIENEAKNLWCIACSYRKRFETQREEDIAKQ